MSGYIGTQPVPQATQTRDSFTATSGQTTFATSGYTPLYLDLFMNGIHLVNNTDYTATNGSDVVLASGAAAGDVIEVVAYTTFEISGVTGLTPSIDDNGNATAITIDSSENVGIGTSSPSAVLDVRRGDEDGKIAEFHQSSGYGFDISSSASVAAITAGYNQAFTFETGTTATERMRIDTSGNLLVGKTASDIAVVGAELKPTGELVSTVNNDSCAFLNRKSSDGAIINLRKDGTTVGYVGTYAGDLTVGTGDTGVRFIDSLDTIVPISDSVGTSRDAAIDLGYSSIRYKDLYLSGGVYVGGTAAANKFDDLESGTWTPQDNSGNNWTQSSTAKYYKIGDLVTCWFDISHNANIGSNANKLGNFPFTSDSGSNYAGTQGYTTSNSSITFHLGSNSKLADFYVANVSTQMTGRLIGSITYRTA